MLADPALPALQQADELTDTLRHNLAYTLNNSGGFTEAEALLRKRSDDRGYQSWFAAIWYEPIKPRTKRRTRS